MQCSQNTMDYCLPEVKKEVEEENSFPGPPILKPFYQEDSTCLDLPAAQTEPLPTESSQQGEFYDDITVKEEELQSAGEEEDLSEGREEVVSEKKELLSELILELLSEQGDELPFEHKNERKEDLLLKQKEDPLLVKQKKELIWEQKEEVLSEDEEAGQFVTESAEVFETEALIDLYEANKVVITRKTSQKIAAGFCLACRKTFADILYHVSSVHTRQKMLKVDNTFRFQAKIWKVVNHKCPICNKKFLFIYRTWRHIQRVHFIKKTLSHLKQKSEVSKQLHKKPASYKQCHICKKHIINIPRHLKVVHNNYNKVPQGRIYTYRSKNFEIKNDKCPLCGGSYSNYTSVCRHIRRVHFNAKRNTALTKKIVKGKNCARIRQKECKSAVPKSSRINAPSVCRPQDKHESEVNTNEKITEEITENIDNDNGLKTTLIQQKKYGSSSKQIQHKNKKKIPSHRKKSNGKLKVKSHHQNSKSLNKNLIPNDQHHENINKITCMLTSVNLENDIQEPPECLINYKTDFNMYISTCYICNQTFSFDYQLKKHMEVMHILENNKACEKCDSKTCWLFYLTQFLHSVRCKEALHECGDNFFPVIKWRSIKSGLNEKGLHYCCPSKLNIAYCCQLCPLSFKNELNLITHLNSHVEQKIISCSKCEKIFLGCYFFDTLFAILPCKKQKFQCNICKIEYVNQRLLQDHECIFSNIGLKILEQDKDKKNFCTVCSMKFTSKENFLTHMKSWHEEEPTKEKNNVYGPEQRSKSAKIAKTANSRLRNVSETESCSSTLSRGASSRQADPLDAVHPCCVVLDRSEVSQYLCSGTGLYTYFSEIDDSSSSSTTSSRHQGSRSSSCARSPYRADAPKRRDRNTPASSSGANKLFGCKHCNKTFIFKIYLYRHIAIAHKHILTKYSLQQ